MGKISVNPRYVIDITGTDPISLGEIGWGIISEKFRKNQLFLTYEGVTRISTEIPYLDRSS